MSPRIKTRIAFISRSMLWSLLLYVVMMLALNWDDVRKSAPTAVTNTNTTGPYSGTPATTPANISAQTGIANSFLNILRVIIVSN